MNRTGGSFTLSLSHRERFRRNQISRIEPLNRSADWQSAVSRIGNPAVTQSVAF